MIRTDPGPAVHLPGTARPLLGRETGTGRDAGPASGAASHPGRRRTLPVPPSPSRRLHPRPQARAWIPPPGLTLHRPWSPNRGLEWLLHGLQLSGRTPAVAETLRPSAERCVQLGPCARPPP